MVYKRNLPCFFAFSFSLVLSIAVGITGCCNVKRKISKKDKGSDLEVSLAGIDKPRVDKSKNTSLLEFDDIHVDLSGQLPIRSKDQLTSELYKKMDYARRMYNNKNYDAALREIERIQNAVDNDPYLMMQSWALSAEVYAKMGKTSRRKRSYSKMLESMREVWKDPRYRQAIADGKQAVEVIDMAKKMGDKKYAFE